MYVLNIIETEGTNNGKKWESRSAVCLDSFHNSSGGGNYVKIIKCTTDCPIPDHDVDVEPLYNKYGKCAEWQYNDG